MKVPYKFHWACTRSGAVDITRREFTTWRQAGEYAAKQEREDRVWVCTSIEREDPS